MVEIILEFEQGLRIEFTELKSVKVFYTIINYKIKSSFCTVIFQVKNFD